jgi:hypothetical protein
MFDEEEGRGVSEGCEHRVDHPPIILSEDTIGEGRNIGIYWILMGV